jgi:hypothetical protein
MRVDVRGRKKHKSGGSSVLGSFIISATLHIVLGWSNRGEREERSMRRRGRNEKLIENFSRKPEGKRPLEIIGQRWEDNGSVNTFPRLRCQ